MPTLETSVDVLLLTSVKELPSRIQHKLSVLQWFATSQVMPLDIHTIVNLSVENTEEPFTDSSRISGCVRLIKDLPRVSQCWLLLQFPKCTTLAFALYCRSSATTSSRMHEKEAVNYTSQCIPHGPRFSHE